MDKTYGQEYQKARKLAMKRSNGVCQFCGQRSAKEVHHWSWPKYPKEINGDHLTALCKPCHEIATTLRRFTKYGGNIYQLISLFMETIAECDMKSISPVLRPSSVITLRQDSIRDLPNILKKRKLIKRQQTIEQ